MLQSQVNLNNLDIQQARIKFILFKSKVRSLLYGGALDESLISSRNNPLGQWLYATALTKYNHIPEIKELEKFNKNLSGQAQELVNQYKKGHIEEARSGLSLLDRSEEELLRILGVLQTKSGV